MVSLEATPTWKPLSQRTHVSCSSSVVFTSRVPERGMSVTRVTVLRKTSSMASLSAIYNLFIVPSSVDAPYPSGVIFTISRVT